MAIEGKTCWKEHMDRDLPCLKQECRMNDERMNLNCVLVQIRKKVDDFDPEADERSGGIVTGYMTFKEVGDLFGLTKQRVEQIEKSLLQKLKNKLEKKNIANCDELVE